MYLYVFILFVESQCSSNQLAIASFSKITYPTFNIENSTKKGKITDNFGNL